MPAESTGLGIAELEAECSELLPERAAMALFNFVDIYATNKSIAVTGYSFGSFNAAGAVQVIITPQS
jgi:hypothetical protein